MNSSSESVESKAPVLISSALYFLCASVVWKFDPGAPLNCHILEAHVQNLVPYAQPSLSSWKISTKNMRKLLHLAAQHKESDFAPDPVGRPNVVL